MSTENTHNCEKIEWNILVESFSKKQNIDNEGNISYKWYYDEKKIKYFSKNLESVIKDFAETFKQEINDDLDPTKWEYGDICRSGQAQMCYADSLLRLYINLNLILMNSYINDTNLLTYYWIYNIWKGHADFKPGHSMISRFEQIYNLCLEDDPSCHYKVIIKKNISKDSITKIKSFLNKIFICMIRLYQSKYHKYKLLSDEIESTIRSYI